MAVTIGTSATLEQIIKSNDIVLVDFWATWCGPCKTFGPIFEAASEKPENADLTFVKIDIDENKDIASAARIKAVPTLMIVKSQQIIFQQAGVVPAEGLDDLIAQARALTLPARKM